MAVVVEVPRVKVFVPCFNAVELARNTEAALTEPVAKTVAVFTAPVTLTAAALTKPVLTLRPSIVLFDVEFPMVKSVPVPRIFPSMMAVVVLAMKTLMVPNWFPML